MSEWDDIGGEDMRGLVRDCCGCALLVVVFVVVAVCGVVVWLVK